MTTASGSRNLRSNLDRLAVTLAGLLGLGVMAYLNVLTAKALWPWAISAWWHAILAFFAGSLLALGPALVIVRVAELYGEPPTSRRTFYWSESSFLSLVALGIAIYGAFTPAGPWWKNGYWTAWAAIVVVLSILAAATRMFSVVRKVETWRPRESYDQEWWVERSPDGRPALGLAMSGGGIRSAAFNIGVLQALHGKQVLGCVDIMSAVSGGTYAMSWFLLQPYYAWKKALAAGEEFDAAATIDSMFANDGPYQLFLSRRPIVVNAANLAIGAIINSTLGQPLRAFGSIGENLDIYNEGVTLKKAYREGIQELFHGHPSPESPGKTDNRLRNWLPSDEAVERFTVVEPVRFSELARFAGEYRFPFFIFNCAVLVDRAHRDELRSTVFEITGADIGADSCGYRSWTSHAEAHAARMAAQIARRSAYFRFLGSAIGDRGYDEWIDMVNVAPAISGAAVGLANRQPAKTDRQSRLRTWTPFAGNLDLGYLYPSTLLEADSAIYVSDGGHAENLGAYALIRRRCRRIIIVDAEHESGDRYEFQAYAWLRQRLEQDESEECLQLRIPAIEDYLSGKNSGAPPPVALGSVSPRSGSADRQSEIVYIKLALGDDPMSYPPEVQSYWQVNENFPQDSTSDQAYEPEQFRAYRALGRHLAAGAMECFPVSGTVPGTQ